MKTLPAYSFILAFALLLLPASGLSAAVLVDTGFNGQGWFATGSGNTNNNVSGSSTFTVGNNSNRALVAIAFARGNESALLGDGAVSLSYGGDAFTRISTSLSNDTPSGYRLATVIYYLENPTTAADATFEYNLGSANRGAALNLLSIHGVASGVPDQVNTTGGNGSSLTTTLNNVAAGSLLVGGAVHEDNRFTFSADGGQTSYGTVLAGGTGDFDIEATSSYKSIDTAGEHSLSWTILNGGNPDDEDYAGTMIAVSAIPEPSAGLLLGLTGVILLLTRRRKG